MIIGTCVLFVAPFSFDTTPLTPENAYAQIADFRDDPALADTDLVKNMPKKAEDAAEPNGCGRFDVVCHLALAVGTVLLRLASIVLWIAGVLLNMSMQISVVSFATWVSEVGGIEIAWTVIRDFANMTFIFMLLYMSISTILQLDSYNMKRSLARLVIVALLINFSLFATKVVIDTSNIIANQFYEGIISKNTARGADGELDGTFAKLNNGVSGAITQYTGVTTIFKINEAFNEDGSIIAGGQLDSGKIIIAGILGTILILVLAFVFFAGAILLILRIISLVILMITSPIAFVAMAFPNAKAYSNRWWKELLKQSFFAPAYFALLFMTVLIISSNGFREALYKSATLNPNYDKAGSFVELFQTGATDVFPILINYAIVIGLALASVKIAKDFGARGSSTVMNWGNSSRKWAQGFVGRNTLGWAGSKLANSKYLQAGVGADNSLTRRIGSRIALNTGEKLESATFGGRKGGFKKAVDDQTKAEERYIKLQAETGVTAEERRKKAGEIQSASLEVAEARRRISDAKKEQKKARQQGDVAAFNTARRQLEQAERSRIDAEQRLQEAWALPIDGGMQQARKAAAENDARVTEVARQLSVPQMEVAQKLYEVEKQIDALDSKSGKNYDKLKAQQDKILNDNKPNQLQRDYSEARRKADATNGRVDKIEKATKQLIAERKMGNYSPFPVQGRAEENAIKNIRKEAAKDKSKKLVDDIKSLVEADNDSGGTNPPTPAAPTT